MNDEVFLRDYVEILEKTNQQLSLWYGPYTLIITILTVLIALLAIFSAVLIWRQSKEHRAIIEQRTEELTKFFVNENIKKLSGAFAKSSLTEEQIRSILELLKSFGEGKNTIDEVERALRGK